MKLLIQNSYVAPAGERGASFAALPWVLCATLILLGPAIIAGRPFIFWDTPTFYSWGHDIVAAIRNPWPPLSNFPAHRGLWAADNMRGAWNRITPDQFQLVLTSIGARSRFYAVPLYLLGSTLTLWAPAVIQSLLVAWMLWITVDILVPRLQPIIYLALVAGLTLATDAALIATFLMPDVFAPLCLLAASLVLVFPDRVTTGRRIGCAAIMLIGTLVHTSNFAVLLALLCCSLVIPFLFPSRISMRPGLMLVIAVLLGFAALKVSSGIGIRMIFGEPVRTAPFVEGRVIADGPGQAFLRDVCSQRHYAACMYKDARIAKPDDIIWPDVGAADLPRIDKPAERRRFLNEQVPVVLGTLERYPAWQLWASAKNAARALVTFDIADSIGHSLAGLLDADTDRTMRVWQIVPDLGPCLASPGAKACDYKRPLRVLDIVQSVAVAAGALFLVWRVLQILRLSMRGGAAPESQRLAAFTLMLAGAVVANAVICGVLSGPFERYQSRVIWLIPMLAMVVEASLRQRAGIGGSVVSNIRRAGMKRVRAAPLLTRSLLTRPLLTRLVRFSVMSGFSALMTIGIPIVLREGFGFAAERAVMIAFAIAFVVNFNMAKRFVFRSAGSSRQELWRFGGSSLLFRLLDFALFTLLHRVFGLQYILALLLLTPVSTLVKFITLQKLVFRQKRPEPVSTGG